MDNNFPDRRTLRLKNYDYAQNGAYFVTICTHQRTPYFSSPAVGADSISARIIKTTFEETVSSYMGVSCPIFVIMPDHFHAIVVFDRADMESAPTLSDVVQAFKRYSTVEYTKAVKAGLLPAYDRRIWQRGYYEHVIRSEEDFRECWKYIEENPMKKDSQL